MISVMFTAMEEHLRAIPAQRTELAPGQCLFHLGDPVIRLHLIQRGSVHLVRYQEDGAKLTLQKAGPGAILAEASLYSESYHCDAFATQATQLRAFAKEDVQRRLRAFPDFAEAWAHHLTHELQRARLQAEILAIKTVAKRLDAWLAWRGDTPGRGGWKLVASEIGVSPEALYRELAKRRRRVMPAPREPRKRPARA